MARKKEIKGVAIPDLEVEFVVDEDARHVTRILIDSKPLTEELMMGLEPYVREAVAEETDLRRKE
jgi:hypothetical protein